MNRYDDIDPILLVIAKRCSGAPYPGSYWGDELTLREADLIDILIDAGIGILYGQAYYAPGKIHIDFINSIRADLQIGPTNISQALGPYPDGSKHDEQV